MATTYHIECDQGATLRRTVTWQDANGDPISLLGYTARMQVRPTVDSDTVLIEATTENGRLILDDTDGTILILIEAPVMEEIEAGTHRYDLEVAIGATPEVTRLIEGRFKVKAEVTRD